MFKWLKERKKKQLIELQKEIDRDARAYSKMHRGEKGGDKPWVTIIGDTVSEEGLQLALDWNDPFIKYLEANGIEGTDDTQKVQRWLAMIAKQTADRLGEEHLELEGKTTEFE